MTETPDHPIRYSRLGHLRLQVTDLDASAKFYDEIVGLARAEAPAKDGGREIWLRCSDKPYDLILTEGDEPGLAEVGFEVENARELEKAAAHLKECGYQVRRLSDERCAERHIEAGIAIANPDNGMVLELYCGLKLCDDAFEPDVAHIARLGHVVLNVASYEQAHRFWVDDLGFAISDHVPGRIAFLRAWPNALHHSFALLEGESDGLNHFNFMVSDIDDIGRAMNRMKKNDVPIVFGPGRHLPSTSIFIYFLDPDGMTAEYSFGMEEIDEDGRPPRELEPKPEVLDTWGGLPDPRFGKKGKILAGHG